MKKRPLPHKARPEELVYLQEMPTGGGSDQTLKENITNLPFILKNLLALRPVVWNWKDKTLGNQREYGFIAQEVEEVLPELVYTDTWVDGSKRKFLQTKALLPYLLAAIKQQQEEIDELRDMLNK